jgi:glycosyltransferase involved in cell wall biosynthesis
MLILAEGFRDTVEITLAARPGTGLLEKAAALDLPATPLDCSDLETLAHWLAAQPIGLLHVHAGIGWEGHRLAQTARRAGVPVVLRTEHLPYLLTEPVQIAEHRSGLSLVDRLICVSSSNAESQQRAGIDPGMIVCIENGIALSKPRRSRTAVRAELGIEQAPMLLMVGRFSPQKGHRLLLEALPAIRRRHLDAVVVLVGEGRLAGEISSAIAELKMGDCVRLVGSRSDVSDLMGAADLLLLPSQFEGLPLVALEAMAIGLPVVGTRVDGVVDAVEDGVTGWLAPAGDAQAFATAVADALDDAPGRAHASVASRIRFEARFRAERMVEQTLSLYRSLIAETRASGAVP